MNDPELFSNFFNACLVYAEEKGSPVTDPDNLCVLKDDGDQKIRIAQWNHDSKQPTTDQLKSYTALQVNNKIKAKRWQVLLRASRLPLMTLAERSSIPNPLEGMMILNTSTLLIQVFVNGAWRNISYSLL